LVAKILVADDNSNIQKMVGLALKDQGLDVVAVGNGEAAVRKISDVHPDLVLADVFMPVRNGYEVCQYVKGDSALAHIPVILLVGAFDPLDEQEAQRVGADGVLKKPFVPPDPLISMVKSALTRAGVSIGGAPPVPVVKEEPLRAADMLTPRTPPPSSIALPALEDFPSAESEPVGDEVASRPAPVRIDTGSQPLAFGSLLETPAAEQEEDLGYATTARPELERDFKSGRDEEEEVEDEEEEKTSSSWRRDAANEALETEAESSSPVKDWREAAFGDAPAPARKSKVEAWTPQKEISAFEEAAEAEESVRAVVTEMPAAQTRLAPVPIAPATSTLAPTAPLTASYAPAPEPKFEPEPVAPAAFTPKPPPAPTTWTSAVPENPFSQDAWAAALHQPAPVVSTEPAEKTEPSFSTYSQEAPSLDEREEAPAVIEMPASSLEIPKAEPPKAPAGDSWFSAVSSPWDGEAQKASQLASNWDAPAVSAPKVELKPEVVQAAAPEAFAPLLEVPKTEDPFATVDTLPSSLSPEVRERVEEAALPVGTVEAIREETQQVTDTVVLPKPVISVPVAPEPAKPAAAVAAGTPSIEDLVAKVLAQMSPEVLQAVTREILKPVVEAMVRDEMNGKK
jgi:CheY-like chemotaxis protein